MGKHWGSRGTSWKNLCGHPLAGLFWERQFGEAPEELGWEKVPNCECLFVPWEQGLFLSVYVDDIKWSERSRMWLPCGRHWWKTLILTNQLHFLIMYTWDVPNVNANRMKFVIVEYAKMFESGISAGATEKLLGWEKPHAKTAAWSYDMEGHARKCVERQCELTNKKVKQLYKVSHLCWDDHQFKQEGPGSVGELSEVRWQIVLKCLYLARIGRHDILWSVHKLARSVTKWTQTCDTRPARLISYTNDVTIVMWETQYSVADLVYSKTQTLLATWRTQNQLQVVSCEFWEVELLSQSLGCARNKFRFRTFLQNLKLFLWMLDYVWMDYLLLIFGTLWLRFLSST